MGAIGVGRASKLDNLDDSFGNSVSEMFEFYVRYDGVASCPPPFCTSVSLQAQ